jgi:gas vesicle protein
VDDEEATMAHERDRIDSESSAGSFLMGLLTGAAIGAGLGLLFAPKQGADLRRELGTRVGTLADAASTTYRQTSDKASGWASKAQESARELANKASKTADAWKERAKDLYGEAGDDAAKDAT